MEIIKSISEAYSMQPNTLTVLPQKERLSFGDHSMDIKRIEREPFDETENSLVGYNFDGKKLFQYREKSVNVHYFTD